MLGSILSPRTMAFKEAGDDKEITILNRTLRWTEEGLEYEADSKHVREIVNYFDLDEN